MFVFLLACINLTASATWTAAEAAATVGNGRAVENTYGRPLFNKSDLILLLQAMKPPWDPMALLRVPTWRST